MLKFARTNQLYRLHLHMLTCPVALAMASRSGTHPTRRRSESIRLAHNTFATPYFPLSWQGRLLEDWAKVLCAWRDALALFLRTICCNLLCSGESVSPTEEGSQSLALEEKQCCDAG